MSSSKDEGAGVAPQNKGSWASFLKSIASFNGDLSSLTAPPFILGTTSLTEFSSYWAEHPSLFVAPAAEPDPARRALLVLRWFLSTLKQQYCSRSDQLGSEKKPLNPFLGELFLGRWEDEAGTTELASEQVSHHPPVTAYSIWNEKHGVRLQGYNAQKASFLRTIQVKQIGHALLHLDAFDEDFLITLPSLHIEGLIYGSPFVELNGKSSIISSSGFVATIEYSGKGWVSGKKNSFKAVLHASGNEKDILYHAEGQWNESFVIRKGGKKDGTTVETFDAAAHPTTKLSLAPIELQDPIESKRAWSKVTAAILQGDMDTVNVEKTKIEVAQREMRKRESAAGKAYQRIFFNRLPNDPLFDKLAAATGDKIEADRTGGVWRFDPEKAKTARPPYGAAGL